MDVLLTLPDDTVIDGAVVELWTLLDLGARPVVVAEVRIPAHQDGR